MAGLEQHVGCIDDAIARHKTVEHRCHLVSVHFHADGPSVERLHDDEYQVAPRL